MAHFPTDTSPLSRRRFFRAAGGVLLAAPALILTPRKGLAQERDPMRAIYCPEGQCGYLYDPRLGDPDGDVPPGVAFEDLPDDWECPECGTPKKLW